LSIALACLLVFVASACKTTPPPPGGAFVDEVAISGLSQPTSVRFARNGKVFVGEKSGVIKVYDHLFDPTPTIFANLRADVHNFWDRGLLDIELDPQFPQQPYVYALYTRDAPIGGTSPTWGSGATLGDPCPTPPGPDTHGCQVSGRLVRLTASGDVAVGAPKVLIDDWCMMSPTHTVGSLAFGPDGALYVSGGDGAFFSTWLDYGQTGIPQKNPCGDPPVPVGGTQTIPTSEGGALRAQDVRTMGNLAADPVTLDGTIIRIDPATGAGLPDNPMASSSDANARRVIAFGLRNPFRLAFRTGTSELWVGDVGWQTWEEINRVRSVNDAVVDNFGWPCYEGQDRQPSWDSANFTICENLYNEAALAKKAVKPTYQYEHHRDVVAGDGCPRGGSITGLAFASPASIAYPAEYQGALFFADYSRSCIWWAPPAADGRPDFTKRKLFVGNAKSPVQLRIGPGGDLFYVSLEEGEIHRIEYAAPPQAAFTATPSSGPAPLSVQFDGTTSTDPGGLALTYAWDLDGDGQYDDATNPNPSWTYTQNGDVTVRLKVTNSAGASGTKGRIVNVGDTPPTPVIDAPTTGTRWSVGDVITFSGHADDTEQGALSTTSLSWALVMNHCPSSCHKHTIQTFDGTAGGQFVAPEHDYPSYLTLTLSATDDRGVTSKTTVQLDPVTTTLQVASNPPGLTLAAGETTGTAPVTATLIRGSHVTVSAPSPQTVGGVTYVFSSWSDGGAPSHDVTVTDAATLTATYVASP
jgi:glucose/arabinose dehydrogenase/PKD repeat protein